MRLSLVVAGIALIAVGGVWILQGIGVLKGSFMTGDASWSWIGAACVLVGLAILARGLRRSGP
jgi:drug/metabolite transporter superfamily protein YnfA